MPSRAELRRTLETVLRLGLLVVLAYALWQSIAGARGADTSISTRTSTLDRGIARVLAEQDVRRVDLLLDATLAARQRDALVALRRSHVDVRWSGELAALATQVIPHRDPMGGAEVRVVGGAGRAVVSDSAGILDTLHSSAAGSLDVGTLVGRVRTSAGGTSAVAAIPAVGDRRPVLVLGRADWESKFVISALMEAGWTVRARIPAAPGVDIRDDGLLPIDTSRYDAVVALDTTAAMFVPAIERFVEQGGGLVTTGAALELAGLRAIAPSGAGARIPGRILLTEDTLTRKDLPFTPLQGVRADALPLEREQPGVALAARRTGMGRVIAVGYDESWRWRMLGGESGLGAHRAWWSRAVASVTAERADSTPAGIDAAPRVAMYRSLGAPTTLEGAHAIALPGALPLWMFMLAVIALLGEIASRRFRGER